MFERFTDRARRVLVLAQEEARLLNHSFIGTEHILLGPDPRGRRRRRQGARVARHLAGSGPREGRRDDRYGRERAERLAAVHAAGQEGARALAARGAAARAQLHRHRAHAARSGPRGRGRGRPGARQPRRRPRPGPPAGHPAHVRLPGQGGRRRRSRVDRVGHADRLAGARPVRPEPDPAGPRRQARPGHRPGERDRAGHAGAVPPHQEQPGADRRARRRQDGHRRGPGPADRRQRRARDVDRQAALHARPRRAGRRQPVPRRLRGAAEEGPEGDPDPRRHHPVHRRAAHAGRRRCGRRGDRRRVDPQAHAGPRRAADGRCHDARRVPQAPREGRRPRAAVPAGEGRAADGRADDRHLEGPARPLRVAPRGHHHRPGAGRGGQPGRPLPGRPVPAGQGDRPDRRGRQPPAHPPDDDAAELQEAGRGDQPAPHRQGGGHRARRLRAGEEAGRAGDRAPRPQGGAGGRVAGRGRRPLRRRRRGGHRRGAGQLDRHPRLPPHRGGDGQAPPHGGRAAQAGHRPGGGAQGPFPGHPPYPGRPQGPEAAERVVHLPRPDRRRARPSWRRRWPSSSSTTRTR